MGFLDLFKGKGKAVRVLTADDDLGVVRLLKDILQMQGYTVITANCGADAIRLALSEHPDLILLDIRMPGMSGLQVLASLKGDPKTRNIPVVMVTAEQKGKDFEDAFALGAKGYILKPIRMEQVVKKVTAIVPPPTKPSTP